MGKKTAHLHKINPIITQSSNLLLNHNIINLILTSEIWWWIFYNVPSFWLTVYRDKGCTFCSRHSASRRSRMWSFKLTHISSIQFSSVAQLCPTLCDPRDCSTPGFPVHHQLLEFTQTHVHWVGDAIQPSHSLSSPSPPAFNLSQHQALFKWVSSLHQVAKVLEFSFSISSSNEYSGLISFRMDWLDLLAVQGTLKSLLQHHSSKASIFLHSAFLKSNSHIHTWLLEKP